ncbi:zinc finger protein 649-like [Periophthalmus magnuspinnatus]|uniref:zinc finger protein 649-like n=1 Tax=Periophthalmus magnuspinnatus TaxID=409849 RepID=UPI00145ADA75|nr:zinc finger protein 649-like [Periophthalmus magnuspinnatus]
MASGYQDVPNVLDDGLSTELMNAGRFCFNCEQIFSSRKCLEEHLCSVPSYICSCGTEFTSYNGMLRHSSSHEPGHQVLCHETIKKRRIEKHWEEEEKLKRLQSGEVIWESPKSLLAKAAPQIPVLPKIQVQPHVLPQLSPDLIKNVSTSDTSKIFSDVGAPTVDLWTLFQPVVLVKTVRSFSSRKPYTCGKCEQSFITRKSLVIHHNTHIADKVSGCIGCGLLLCSRKIVPRFHPCNAPHGYKFKVTTARPINQITANITNGLAKAANSSPPQNAQNNGSCRKIKIVMGVNYSPSAAKRPKPSQTKPIISNAKSISVNNPPAAQAAPGAVTLTPGKGYECRVCHVFFESINVLQRHKCAKAHEFLMKHKLTAPANRQRQVVPLQIPSSSLQKSVAKAVLSAPAGNTDIKSRLSNMNNKDTSTAVTDDDCFIVESGPEKPAEVIYQVTSSVPIKT